MELSPWHERPPSVREVTGSIPIEDSGFFCVSQSCHGDHFIFPHFITGLKICYHYSCIIIYNKIVFNNVLFDRMTAEDIGNNISYPFYEHDVKAKLGHAHAPSWRNIALRGFTSNFDYPLVNQTEYSSKNGTA